jgi:hypothetical protein
MPPGKRSHAGRRRNKAGLALDRTKAGEFSEGVLPSR